MKLYLVFAFAFIFSGSVFAMEEAATAYDAKEIYFEKEGSTAAMTSGGCHVGCETKISSVDRNAETNRLPNAEYTRTIKEKEGSAAKSK